jgi:hypothetical protein
MVLPTKCCERGTAGRGRERARERYALLIQAQIGEQGERESDSERKRVQEKEREREKGKHCGRLNATVTLPSAGMVLPTNPLSFITLEPSVEWPQKSMRRDYEPPSEPLRISSQQFFLN